MGRTTNKRKQIVYLIPEGETRDSHTYHYTAEAIHMEEGMYLKYSYILLKLILFSS